MSKETYYSVTREIERPAHRDQETRSTKRQRKKRERRMKVEESREREREEREKKERGKRKRRQDLVRGDGDCHQVRAVGSEHRHFPRGLARSIGLCVYVCVCGVYKHVGMHATSPAALLTA